MNLDDELRRMFRDERLDLRPSAGAGRTIVTGARKLRRRRRGLAVGTGVLAAVAAMLAGMSVSGFGATSQQPPAATTHARQQLPTVLGPNNFGQLRLGMTREQAHETGMLDGRVLTPSADEPCSTHELVDAKGARYGEVTVSNRLGLVRIRPENTPRTPEGIRAGSTTTQAMAAYPVLVPPNGEGTAGVPVPGNSRANYTVTFAHSKVLRVELGFKDDDCG
ncbi:hypothetical protein [Allokutzneria oryzae]|uniref:Uncharacterized protein n=1 Tax=Allokutzneria oryzae TaxID=1378989 RepID=A0ABV6A001_9PSEU